MTSKHELPLGLYDIIPEDQLYNRTTDGWAIVRVLRVRQSSSYANPSQYYNNQGQPQYSGQNRNSNDTFKFLVRKSVESAVRKLQTEVTDLQVKLKTSTQETTNVTKDRNTTADKLARIESELDAANKGRTKAVQELEEQQRVGAQMRDALGKIWVQIGEAKMKEILGPEAKNPQPVPDKVRLTAFERISMNEEEETK